jgi:hypothetical protein
MSDWEFPESYVAYITYDPKDTRKVIYASFPEEAAEIYLKQLDINEEVLYMDNSGGEHITVESKNGSTMDFYVRRNYSPSYKAVLND